MKSATATTILLRRSTFPPPLTACGDVFLPFDAHSSNLKPLAASTHGAKAQPKPAIITISTAVLISGPRVSIIRTTHQALPSQTSTTQRKPVNPNLQQALLLLLHLLLPRPLRLPLPMLHMPQEHQWAVSLG